MLNQSKDRTIEHKYGKVGISGELVLRRIEPSPKLTSKEKLITLVNDTLQEVARHRAFLSLPQIL